MTVASRKSIELATAAAIGVFGSLIVVGSVQHDVGWSSTGPQAGYFPLRIGGLLCATSILLFIQALLSANRRPFATWVAFRHSLTMFIPTLAFVIGMGLVGCYVSTLFYLVYMIRAHGRYGWVHTAIVSTSIVAAFYLIFEIWFLVPLAKGPVENLFGIY